MVNTDSQAPLLVSDLIYVYLKERWLSKRMGTSSRLSDSAACIWNLATKTFIQTLGKFIQWNWIKC